MSWPLSILFCRDGDHDGDDTTKTGFVYGAPGQLLGQYSTDGRLQETVWLGKIPVVVMTRWRRYAIHSDQRNTPRQIRNGLGFTVWKLPYSAFGAAQPISRRFTYNLRFAGQYHDAETGLDQNYFRDYDPKTGRYIESDPIGLAGGPNTYIYVGDNPVRSVDPLGLCTSCSEARAAVASLGEQLSSTGQTLSLTGIGIVGASGVAGIFAPEGAPVEITTGEQGVALIEAGRATSTLGGTLKGYANGGVVGAAEAGFISTAIDRTSSRVTGRLFSSIAGSSKKAFSSMLAKITESLHQEQEACGG